MKTYFGEHNNSDTTTIENESHQEIPNHSSAEDVPTTSSIRRILPQRQNRGIPKPTYEPNNNTLPMSMYEVKKTMKVLGLHYEKIHACPNDYILYRNEFADPVECPNCGASRYQIKKIAQQNLGKGFLKRYYGIFHIFLR